VNEEAVAIENDFVRASYKYNYFIQIDLNTINGLT